VTRKARTLFRGMCAASMVGGLVLWLVVFAGSGASARPATRAASPELLDTLTTSATQNAPTVGTVSLEAGTQYTLVVSGTMTRSSSSGSYAYDALYCITNTVQSYGCMLSPPNRDRTPAIVVGTDTGHLGTIDAFEQPGSAPTCSINCPGPQGYNANNVYTVPFYPPTTGPLQAGWVGAFVPGQFQEFDSGTITIRIYREPGARISALTGKKVEVQVAGGPWQPATAGMTLHVGDRIHSGWKSSAMLTFPDGSTMEIDPMALVSLEKLKPNLGYRGFRVRVLLRLGEVGAQVQKIAGAASDFEVRTPTLTTSSRGTIWSVLYDGSATIVSVHTDKVAVTPNRGSTVVVPAGREVAGTATSVGPLMPIGKAGVPPGSVGPARAVALLSEAIANGVATCNVSPYGTGLKPTAHGWNAIVAIVGSPSGNASWTIAGTRVRPVNKLAKRIAAGCPGGSSSGPPNLTGLWVNKAATTSPPWQLTTSHGRQALDAAWTGGPGHTGLRGSFHGSLRHVNRAYVYEGSFHVTEAGVGVHGTMSFTIDNANQVEINFQANGGNPQHYTFVRVS
jgi:hypothetical protein